jgi:hypothetical protein
VTDDENRSGDGDGAGDPQTESWPELDPETTDDPDGGDSRTDPIERLDAGDRDGDPFTSAESAFEWMDVDDLDPDAVWEDLSAAAQDSVTEQDGSVDAEVSKHRFCEQCEFFSDPPDATCTHDGTQIVEFLDMETVRVLDCPVVEERRALEERE